MMATIETMTGFAMGISGFFEGGTALEKAAAALAAEPDASNREAFGVALGALEVLYPGDLNLSLVRKAFGSCVL